ncbi:MAG: ribonuclease P protein component [Rhodocyclaceae bacterium]|nr:ribonuclease P protein component [Rhodocyclaceae bacterium]
MNSRGPVADSGRLGFGRAFRLLRPQEFAAVFSARRTSRGTRFVLHYKENGLPHPRLGLVIPKKLARTAVLRNAIKRQAREAFRLNRPGLPAFDLVLRLVQPVTLGEKSDWRVEIGELFGRFVTAGHKKPVADGREGNSA